MSPHVPDTPDDIASDRLPAGLLIADTPYFTVIRARLRSYVHRRYYASADERDDLVSEILAVLVHSLRNGSFQGRDLRSLNAFVYGIARLKIMKAVERTGRRNELSQHLRSGDLMIHQFTNPETRAIRTDLLERIYDGLDPRCREIMRLKFAEGWTDQEIADLKKITKNALSTAISRCLDKARKLKPITEILYQDGRSRDS